MVRFGIGRDELLDPLQLAVSVVERKQVLPILSHVLCEVSDNLLTLTGSDQEIEVSASCELQAEGDLDLQFTLPGRKFFDICRNLPAGCIVEIEPEGLGVRLKSDRFRSQLVGLPGHDFPKASFDEPELRLSLSAKALKELIDQVAFAMAQQDVRYFFNGLLLEFSSDKLRAVATNGQRLAIADLSVSSAGFQAIVPRKAIAEIQRMTKGDGEVELLVNQNHLRLIQGGSQLTTKLIDAVYPDYNRAVPSQQDKKVVMNRLELKSALVRISILSNELYRNVRLTLSENIMKLNANNPMQEEAEEILAIDYLGEPVEIGFNVSYLTDVLSVISGDEVELSLSDASSPMLVKDPNQETAQYVISPMVL